MNTDELIDSLSRDVAPVSRHAVGWRLLAGVLIGSLVSVSLVVAVLGLRPDLGEAMHGFEFWMKWTYTGSLALCAIAATIKLARPDSGRLSWLWILTLPVGALAITGIAELVRMPPSGWMDLWLGKSWQLCSALVFLLSIPIFGGLLWSFRLLAPTRLRAAGATAGLTAGAWAATLYCLHCPEASAIFVLTWYSLGIALAALLGSVIGPRLLRW